MKKKIYKMKMFGNGKLKKGTVIHFTWEPSYRITKSYYEKWWQNLFALFGAKYDEFYVEYEKE